jgi:pyruvate kinase
MLDSMMEHPRPTRAEASDVANAIWDGADAVMLSGESASGRFPLLAVQTMDRIVREAERNYHLSRLRPVEPPPPPVPFNDVVASAAVRAALDASARCIACFTVGGTTARLLSRYRPHVPVVAFSPEQPIRRRMALYWGVLPRIMEPIRDPDTMARLVSGRGAATEDSNSNGSRRRSPAVAHSPVRSTAANRGSAPGRSCASSSSGRAWQAGK